VTRTRSALLWGLVGALTFLVLLQGYRLLVGTLDIGLPATAGVAVGIGVAVGGISYVAEPRLAAKGRT